MIIGRFDEKIHFFTFYFLSNKNKKYYNWPFDVLSYETINFSKYYMAPELCPKMHEKRQKTGIRKNGINPKSTIFFFFKICYENFKTNMHIVLKF